jgi:hypothetical protein
MEQNEEKERVLLLVVKSSRISSLKSLFFPMEYHFYDVGGRLRVQRITKNWIGQKSTHVFQLYPTASFFAKGIILRTMSFSVESDDYGLFWRGSVKKVRNIIEQYIKPNARRRWSDTWF